MPGENIFELPEMARILGLKPAKAKNWTNERTGLVIEPSIRKSTGTGKSNLYSLEDLYMMAVAQEFSKAGFAAKAIGRLQPVIRPLLGRAETVTIWRLTEGGPFHVETRRLNPEISVLWHVFEIGDLLRGIDQLLERRR